MNQARYQPSPRMEIGDDPELDPAGGQVIVDKDCETRR